MIGTTLRHYRITDKLGEGGMGVVYRAHDERLDRNVAVKVLHEAVAQDVDRLARFEREAKAVAKLDHPNILAIHDFGIDQGVTYAVTELLDGKSLRQSIPASGIALAESVETVRPSPTASAPLTAKASSIAISNRRTSLSPPTGG